MPLRPNNTCGICWDKFVRPLHRRPCCPGRVCSGCMAAHIRGVLTDDSRFELNCPCCSKLTLTDLEIRCAIRSANMFGIWFKTVRRELANYERWSVAVALRRSDEDEILRCPGINCDVLWVVSTDRRRSKLAQEPSRVWSPMLWGLYAAPKTPDGGDERRVYCEFCKRAFCGLCRRNWQQPQIGHRPVSVQRNLRLANHRYAAPVESHDGRACVAFARKSLIHTDDDYAAVAAATGARACPGCSLRIDRTAGCNHITCPQCATHWCFICEQRWAPAHYACRDSDGSAYKVNTAQNPNCALM